MQDNKREAKIDAQVSSLESSLASLDCDGKDSNECAVRRAEISQTKQKNTTPGKEVISGIRGVYDFLGNIPLISLHPETVTIDIPYGVDATWDKALLDWELATTQWKQEAKNFANAATL